MLLQARLDFVIYSIGIDFESLVVKIKYLVVGDGVLPKVSPIKVISSTPLTRTNQCIIHAVYFKGNVDHHGELLPLG
jgi:hypothetical protein